MVVPSFLERDANRLGSFQRRRSREERATIILDIGAIVSMMIFSQKSLHGTKENCSSAMKRHRELSFISGHAFAFAYIPVRGTNPFAHERRKKDPSLPWVRSDRFHSFLFQSFYSSCRSWAKAFGNSSAMASSLRILSRYKCGVFRNDSAAINCSARNTLMTACGVRRCHAPPAAA
jgi:hypothetical protein